MKLSIGEYEVKTENYSFQLDISKIGRTYSITYGDAGSKEGPCVELTYETNSNHAKIDHVVYDKRCAIPSLKRGSGTREMIESILYICAKKFKAIEYFTFNDVSSVKCNGEDLFLPDYYLCKNAQTWYEKHFGAVPQSERFKSELEKYKRFLRRHPKVGVYSFYDVQTNHTSWLEYFGEQPCEFFLRHKKELVKVAKVKLVYSEWIIPRNNVKEQPIKVKPIKLAGGAFCYDRKTQAYPFEVTID